MIRARDGLALAALLLCVGCQQSSTSGSSSTPALTSDAASPSQEAAPPPAAPKATPVTLPSGLIYEDLAAGTGSVAESGRRVSVHYTGWLTDGTKFDSSLDRGESFGFLLGAGQVIRGWDQGVAGMRVGGKRRLTIPPALAYGSNGVPGAIPPNATLVFEVELLGVQ